MAGARGRLHKSATAPTGRANRRSTKHGKAYQQDDDVPDVFQDMLSDTGSSKAIGQDEDDRPLKKRKTARAARENGSNPAPLADTHMPKVAVSQPQAPPSVTATDDDMDGRQLQTLELSDNSEESDESDMEWEDALQGEDQDDDGEEANAEPELNDLTITIGGDGADLESKTKKQIRRRGITSVDKEKRLDIHKMHVLCLLYHVHQRNSWCNDSQGQSALRKLPSPKLLDNLVPNPEYSQFQASKRFIDGLQELKMMWSKKFSVTAMGMHKAKWVDAGSEAQAFSEFAELDDPMDKQDFRAAAVALQGSQDVGAQLFCALLRAVGVEARLVCSLQCLPFVSAAQPTTPQKAPAHRNSLVLDPYNTAEASISKADPPAQPKARTPSRPKKLTKMERVLGERTPKYSAGVAPKQKKKYHTQYPVYWVEACNPATQKWITIDVHSTYTVDKPEKIEPPLNSTQNSLVYVVAFEKDSTVKDVTRRYAKAYNAKTRKFRVESTEGGVQWWRNALKPFRRHVPLDRDQLEDAALARKEATEGVPKNVQDFRNHPNYVLERHLRHNEVIYPKNPIGKVNVGSSINAKMEPIYRRKEVHIVRSADRWYRLGRDVMDGEQPLKHAKPKRSARKSMTPGMEYDEQQEDAGVGLYAYFQTELYVPPPVMFGKVPRNAFGNLDLYVPSMVPEGGIHIRHALAAKAARSIGVDWVAAVTGFSFKGRHGTAIIQGCVIAEEYKEAVEAAIDAMEHEQQEAERAQRSAEALRLWRRFFLGLRIAQRINAIEIDGETGPQVDISNEIEREDKEIRAKEMAGGFFPEGGDVPDVEPAMPVRSYQPPQEQDPGGGFVPNDDGDGGGAGFVPEDNQGGGFVPDDDEGGSIVPDEDLSGGFVRDDLEEEGGGFVPPGLARFGSSILEQQELRPTRTDYIYGVDSDEMDVEEEGGGFLRNASPVAGPSNSDLAAAKAGEGSEAAEMIWNDEVAAELDRVVLAQPDAEAATTVAEQIKPVNSELTQSAESAEATVLEEPVIEETVPPSSLSETGSLPLEDPDDEDADPEWLVDVT